MKATGINFAQLMARQGLYDRNMTFPTVLGVEAAGDVCEVGKNVKKLNESQIIKRTQELKKERHLN